MTREGAGAEERAEMLHALCDCDGKHIYSDCPMLRALADELDAASAAATAKERENRDATWLCACAVKREDLAPHESPLTIILGIEAKARAGEREQCARVCERWIRPGSPGVQEIFAQRFAAEIRARGDEQEGAPQDEKP